MMNGGMTFRGQIERNKAKILAFLASKGKKQCTADICRNYEGDRDMAAVRKALNELRKEEKVTTDDKVYFWQGKFWELTSLEALRQRRVDHDLEVWKDLSFKRPNYNE